jgi:two-component system cell cycle response regulator
MAAALKTTRTPHGTSSAPPACAPARPGSRTLVRAVETHDRRTARHCYDVLGLARRVAQALGLHETMVTDVEQVALLHDVGKVVVPHAILSKPGPLDDHEWAIMREHSAAGADAVAQVSELARLAPAVRACHERWDGTGYPDGLAGAEIPVASRITFACDAYDAMRSDRSYRAALSYRQAVTVLRAGSGTQFCPASVTGLCRVLGAV